MTTAVLSDLDGVLVDSRDSIERGWRLWAARRGLPEPADEQLHGRTSAAVVAELAPDLDAETEAAEVERIQAERGGAVTALPGAVDLLTGWPRERLAIVTSGTHDLAAARLQAAGLPMPDVLVTAERVSRGKPDPEGYLLAARELGADPAECVVLEDAAMGVTAGLAAGMRVVGIADSNAADELAEAHVVVASVADWLRSFARTRHAGGSEVLRDHRSSDGVFEDRLAPAGVKPARRGRTDTASASRSRRR